VEDVTGLDARFLYSETRTAHMHTLKIAVVDLAGRTSPLTADSFADLMFLRLDRLPLLRRRAVPVPCGIGRPIWVEDPEFDLASHLHWCVAESPGSDRELATVVARIAATQLPRDRPLWDLTVVEGLERDRTAFVMKLHHSLADGGAAVTLLENVFMADDDKAFKQPSHPEPLPSQRELLRHALMGRAHDLRGVPGVVRRNLHGVAAARRASREIDGRLPRPFSGPRTPFNLSLDTDRTYAMTALPLADLLAIKKAASVSLNDVFLGLCGGAIRHYLARRRRLPSIGLVAGVPLATHVDQRHYGGNHVDNLMLPVPTDLADPAARLRLIHEASVSARHVREALGTELFEDRAELTPPLLYPLGIRMWARTRLANRTRPPINLVASNVRGPREVLEIEGGVVTDLFSVGPILEGIGLNITAWSYLDRLEVSVLGCPSTLPDPWELIGDLLASAGELAAAYGVPNTT
jgi:diacylglycerol O-acyltransferase